jgi:hypothetical protein
MSLVEHHIRLAYQELGDDVSRALQTQVGDAARLNEYKRRCLQFLQDIQQVRVLICITIKSPLSGARLSSTSGFFLKLIYRLSAVEFMTWQMPWILQLLYHRIPQMDHLFPSMMVALYILVALVAPRLTFDPIILPCYQQVAPPIKKLLTSISVVQELFGVVYWNTEFRLPDPQFTPHRFRQMAVFPVFMPLADQVTFLK